METTEQNPVQDAVKVARHLLCRTTTRPGVIAIGYEDGVTFFPLDEKA